MGITVEVLIAVFAILLTISLAAERLIEFFKPLLNKVPEAWNSSVKLMIAIFIGTGCAALFRFDLLAKLGVEDVSFLVGYLAAGLISSTGSTTINRFLEWLKTLKNDTTTTVTKTTIEDDISTQVVATMVTDSKLAPETAKEVAVVVSDVIK